MSKDLAEAALRLKKAAPQSFNDFVNALFTVHQQNLIDLTGAPPETVLVHQGQAQQSAKLLRVLQECHLWQQPASR